MMSESQIQYFKAMLPDYSNIIVYSWAMGFDQDEVKEQVIPIQDHSEWDKLTKPSNRDRYNAQVNYINLISGKIKYEYNEKTEKWELTLGELVRDKNKPFDLSQDLHSMTVIDPSNSLYFIDQMKYPDLVEPFIRIHFKNRNPNLSLQWIMSQYGLTHREARTINTKYKYL